jgi:hypothetical protein
MKRYEYNILQITPKSNQNIDHPKNGQHIFPATQLLSAYDVGLKVDMRIRKLHFLKTKEESLEPFFCLMSGYVKFQRNPSHKFLFEIDWVCWGSGPLGENENKQAKLVNQTKAHSAPFFPH